MQIERLYAVPAPLILQMHILIILPTFKSLTKVPVCSDYTSLHHDVAQYYYTAFVYLGICTLHSIT